ncbi:hypothetical protein ACWJJH_16690 [Endozoicomonadaceae bacterium StTr2]
MKFFKYLIVLAISVVLTGCGGHGFEGEYEAKADSSNKFLSSMAGAMGSDKLVIGADFIESGGSRTMFDEIFVRESGSEKYLVFKNKEGEEGWKIVDDNTLIQGNGLVSVKLTRVN